MNQFDNTVVRTSESILETNKVLKNTYVLLSMTLLFSALMAFISIQMLAGHPSGGVISISCSIAAMIILFFVMPRYEESSGIGGLVVTFLFTGLLGFGLGPLLGAIMANSAGGAQIVSTALGGTGIIFLALSGYAITTKKDFSFLGGFLMAGLVVLFLAIIANLFLNIGGLSLAINVGVLMIFSGLILWDTSRIIHGGETNYIRATVGLYISIYNIFISLLQLLMAFSGND